MIIVDACCATSDVALITITVEDGRGTLVTGCGAIYDALGHPCWTYVFGPTILLWNTLNLFWLRDEVRQVPILVEETIEDARRTTSYICWITKTIEDRGGASRNCIASHHIMNPNAGATATRAPEKKRECFYDLRTGHWSQYDYR